MHVLDVISRCLATVKFLKFWISSSCSLGCKRKKIDSIAFFFSENCGQKSREELDSVPKQYDGVNFPFDFDVHFSL